jgi:hypothetical protein
VIVIPMLDQNSFVIEASLDESTYFLQFDWNSEAQFWTMAIANYRNEAILQSVVLVPNSALIGQFRHLDVPAGEFIVYCSEDKSQVTRDNFIRGKCELFYLTESEYASL